jgi:LDH2 family malate/lactate/ureidoglycolate dehydrogenase
MEAMSDRVHVAAEAAESFAQQVLLAHGLPEADAKIVAACLVSADLRGVDTHGICRLPIYLDRVRRGLVNAKPNLAPKRVTPVAASLEERFLNVTHPLEDDR